MRARHHFSIAVIALLALVEFGQSLGVRAEALSERVSAIAAANDNGGLVLQLFGCLMPLPAGYVLRADAEPFFLYKKSGLGTISIGPYEEPNPETLEILEETSVGKLTVVWVASRVVQNRPTLRYVHDGKMQIVITGEDDAWTLEMARSCLKNPKS